MKVQLISYDFLLNNKIWMETLDLQERQTKNLNQSSYTG